MYIIVKRVIKLYVIQDSDEQLRILLLTILIDPFLDGGSGSPNSFVILALSTSRMLITIMAATRRKKRIIAITIPATAPPAKPVPLKRRNSDMHVYCYQQACLQYNTKRSTYLTRTSCLHWSSEAAGGEYRVLSSTGILSLCSHSILKVKITLPT